MKTNIRTLAFLFVLVTATVISPKQASAQQDYVSLQVFYDELSPYGEWVDYPQYGYVWIPDAGSDFMPYSSRGQWIFTDYGWTWVSDYEWGWAPFHYGRWDYDNYYGWLWVPDYEWGPSWVTWRSARGYYGWQPMRPGISISLSFGNDYYNDYNDYWMFVSDRDFQRPNVSRYYINQTSRDRIIRNSTVINNTYIDNRRNTTYVAGPAREDVQRNTGRSVSYVAIRENSTPGQVLKNGQLQIYRPQVRNNSDTGRKPAPTLISSREDIQRPSERNGENRQRNVSPNNNNRQERQIKNERQQNNNRIDQPSQQRNVNSPANRRLERQQQQQEQRQNIDKGNSQREQQQRINQSENDRQRQQRQQRQQQQNTINQQNIDKGNAQREQQQKVNQSENNNRQQQQQQNIDKNNAQPAQQQKVDAPQNNVREQRQINRQEKNDRNRQEKENKKRQE